MSITYRFIHPQSGAWCWERPGSSGAVGSRW